MVPYIDTAEDGSTDRCFAKLTFSGDVDRRRVRRELRKWVKRSLKRTLHPVEQAMVMRRSLTVL